MEPDILDIKNRQKKWMRERQIEIEKQGMPNLSAGDLVNALTDKITSQMPKRQERLEKAVADELETNTCSICFEIMLPKVHSPILLFPCGHTFCKECVEHAFRCGQKKCPWCREKIASHAVNISLQNIIVAFARKNNIKVTVEPEKETGDYETQLEMYELRCKILNDEKNSNVKELEMFERHIKNEENSVDVLKNEERLIIAKIESAEKELELVREHMKRAQNSVEKMYKEYENRQKTIELIEDTLVPVDREKRKLVALIEIQKGNKR